MEQRASASAEIDRIKERLIENYNTIYEEYSRIQLGNGIKENTILKKAVTKDDYNNKEYEMVLNLAQEGMPEAIFEICSFHTADVKKLKIDKRLLPLFGANYVADETNSQNNNCNGKITRCGILNYYEFANKILSKKNNPSSDELKKYEVFKREWTERRESVFSGTMDGLYDENTTLNYVLTKIIPIATKDILESVCNFYNKPDAFVPPEDIEEFNAFLTQKNQCRASANQSSTEEFIPQKGKNSVGQFQNELDAFNERIVLSKEDYNDNVFEDNKIHLNYQELDVISNEIRRSVKKPSCSTTATAFFVVISDFLKEYEDIERLKHNASILIYNLNNSKTKWLINFLSEYKYIQRLFEEVLDKFRHESGIPEPWEIAIKEKFCTNDVLTSKEVGWWIGKLASFNILIPYFGNNIEFWSNMMPANAGVLIKRFEKCLYPDDYLNFAVNVCNSMRPPKSNATSIYLLWRDSLTGYLLDMPNTEDNLKRFRSAMEHLTAWTEDQREIVEAFYLKAHKEIISRADCTKNNSDDSGNQLQIDQYASNFKSFEEFEAMATTYIDSGSECSGIVTQLMKQAIQTREAFAYYLEHMYGSVMKPVVSDEMFLNRKPFPFNPNEHICGTSGKIEVGAPVVAQTMGVKIKDVVKYKAKVKKSNEEGN